MTARSVERGRVRARRVGADAAMGGANAVGARSGTAKSCRWKAGTTDETGRKGAGPA